MAELVPFFAVGLKSFQHIPSVSSVPLCFKKSDMGCCWKHRGTEEHRGGDDEWGGDWIVG